MIWEHWIGVFTRTHCIARGLRSATIAAYEATLRQFRSYARFRLDDRAPDRITTRDVLAYLQHLREDRSNGEAAVNRQLTILRGFYRAIVAMGYLDPPANPLAGFPTIKATPRKLPTVLSATEVEQLLAVPDTMTILGLRDRAILSLLYGTGVRASECASLRQGDVDLDAMTVTVTGKGGHQRTIPLNERVAQALDVYARARGASLATAPFFRSRRGRAMSRYALYERVRTLGARARLRKGISPHSLRHTFASHLVQEGVGLVTIRDLLGHRLITSTQVYLHVTAHDLRAAAARHPIAHLLATVQDLLPDVKLPLQYAPSVRKRG
jgi:integrase/recombinase XerD